jgi:hypothetical protein
VKNKGYAINPNFYTIVEQPDERGSSVDMNSKQKQALDDKTESIFTVPFAAED